MSDAARAEAVRRAAGLFALPERGALRVGGSDRLRWLNGMLTNDVAALAARGAGAGGYGVLLTRQGRIVADLHELVFAGHFLLETARAAVPGVIAHLGKFVIADDVTLEDASPDLARLALEGPAAAAVLERACGQQPARAAGDFREHELGGVVVPVAAFAFTCGPGFQLFAPVAGADAVAEALRRVGAELGLVEGDAELFELLRIEAGTPLLGRELDESVLPDEARLEGAVSTTKGCYTGQEVVARLRSRDRLNHRLVGLRLAGHVLPAPRSAIELAGARVGELTSVVASPRFGAIALGFVKREHAEPGTELEVSGAPARVAELPFAEGGAAQPAP